MKEYSEDKRPVHTSPTMHIMMRNNARCIHPHRMCIRVMRINAGPFQTCTVGSLIRITFICPRV